MLYRNGGDNGVAKTVEAIEGGDPNIAFTILKESLDVIGGETIGLQSDLKPGSEEVVRTLDGAPFALAICRDLVFTAFGRRYGRLGVSASGWL